jgi:Zn-dependent protease
MMIVPCNIAIVGWGRPVPVDIRNFKYRTIGDICTNLAGPFSNLIVATFLMIINCSPWFCHNNVVRHLLAIAACMNISLAIFNLLPLPPLDGSCLLKYVTNMSEEAFLMISQWSYIIMLVLINLPQFRHLLFNAINYTFYGIGYLSCKIVGTTEDMLFSFIK